MNAPRSGKNLEEAVRLLQQTILQSDPSFKSGEFTVEINKRVVINGTPHEVDVYVVTKPKTRFESVILFECKDWSRPVSKNEVINLKGKVDLFGAARGVLVAESLTKGARALLNQTEFKRIEFRRFSKDLREMFGLDVHETVHELLSANARVISRESDTVFPSDFLHAICRWKDRLSLFEAIVRDRIDQIVKKDRSAWAGEYPDESVHWRNVDDVVEFGKGEFFLGDIELAAMVITVTFFAEFTRATPRFQCSIDGDGEVHLFELQNENFPNNRIQINMILANRRDMQIARQ